MKKLLAPFAVLSFALATLFAEVTPANAETTVTGPIVTTGDYGQVGISADGSIVALSTEYESVTIYETATGDSRTITTPSEDAGFPAISPDNRWLYVASYSPHAIYVYDLTDDSFDRTISMSTNVWNLTMSPDGNTLYASAYEGVLWKIALNNNDALTGPLNIGSSWARNMCLSSDGSTLYYPDAQNQELDVVTTSTFTNDASWATSGAEPTNCSMDNDDNVFVADSSGYVIDKFTSSGTRTSSGTQTYSMYGIAASCESLYVGDYSNPTIGVLDLADFAPGTEISVPGESGPEAKWNTYSAARSADGSVIAMGGFYYQFGLLVISNPQCQVVPPTPPGPDPLPDTGVNAGMTESVSVAAAVLSLLGIATLVAVRRRARHNLVARAKVGKNEEKVPWRCQNFS